MTLEDAYYYKILLSMGFDDGYYEWLDGFLERGSTQRYRP